jgi:L-aspartate oxidase
MPAYTGKVVPFGGIYFRDGTCFMKGLPAETDFVVIGAGVAGLRAGIELAAAGRVLILTKKDLTKKELSKKDLAQKEASKTATASNGLAAVLSDEDEIILHLQDTLTAGDGLCNPAAAKILVEEGMERIEELIAWGAHERGGTKLVFGPESGHSKGRILHASGESTGTEILHALVSKAHALKNITVAEHVFTTELLCEDGRITSVSVLDDKGMPHDISCSAVLLATGAMGQIYRSTTNLEAATGDGIALAYRTGAEIGDMEFVQFHPTVLYVKKAPRFLLSEALRMEGAQLRNIELNRFMGKYHPLAELAPRDLVARAIVHEMEVSRTKDPFVYLDLTHLSAVKVQKRFPRIYATCMQHNIDITEDVIPVRPAAHYSVGGVRTDLDGKTNIAGLYAAGEVATTGVHGANRLPSNSLLESLVYGARAGRAMRESLKVSSRKAREPKAAYSNGPVDAGVEELIGKIQDLMWSEVAIVRTRMGMQKALNTLQEMAPKLAHPRTRRSHEAANIHLAAILVARSALTREESRGAHYRMDYPDHDDKKFLKHSIVQGDKVRFV